MEMSDTISLDVADKDNIFVVQENPYFVAVVYPKEKKAWFKDQTRGDCEDCEDDKKQV